MNNIHQSNGRDATRPYTGRFRRSASRCVPVTARHTIHATLLALLLLLAACADSPNPQPDAPVAAVESVQATEQDSADVAATGTPPSSEPAAIEAGFKEGQPVEAEGMNSAEVPSESPARDNSMSMSGNSMMGGTTQMQMTSGSGEINYDAFNAQALSNYQRETVERVIANNSTVADALALVPAWTVEIYATDGDEDAWMDFYTDDDWMGYAGIDLTTGVVYDYEMVAFLPEEQLATMLPIIEQAALASPEVQALMGDATAGEWYTEPGYDPYEGGQFYFYIDKGLESWTIWLYEENGQYEVASIEDPEALDAEKQRNWERDQAIEIAWENETLWALMDGIDDYETYVTAIDTNQYAVSFATPEREIFYALIDIVTREVLETSP